MAHGDESVGPQSITLHPGPNPLAAQVERVAQALTQLGCLRGPTGAKAPAPATVVERGCGHLPGDGKASAVLLSLLVAEKSKPSNNECELLP